MTIESTDIFRVENEITGEPSIRYPMSRILEWVGTGTANQVLKTDGAGNLSWATVSGVAGVGGTGTTGKLTKWSDGAGSIIADSIISESGTVATVTGTLVVTGNVFTIRGVAYTFPAADGTSGYVLSTNGSGTLSWVAQTGGGSGTVNTGVGGHVAYYPSNGTTVDDLADGAAGAALTTDGAATLSWVKHLPLAGGTLTGNVLFSTDNTLDIGASGATRPRTGYFGTSVVTPLLNNSGSTITLRGVTYTLPAADGTSSYVLSTNGSGTLSWVAQTGGSISGLTTGKLAKAASSSTLADSIVSESGTVLTVTGTLVVTGNVFTIRSVAYTFPSADGTSGYALTTNGSGTLSWSPVGSVATIRTATANDTLTLADLGAIVQMNVGSANTATIPPNSSVAFPNGATVSWRQMGAGATTITAGAGVTLVLPPGKSAVMKGQGSIVSAYHSAVTDTWVVDGDLTWAAPLAQSSTQFTSSLPFVFPATTTSLASINMAHGTAPTSPVNGDVWTTTAGLYVRVNGSTVGPLAGSSSNALTLNTQTASYTAVLGDADVKLVEMNVGSANTFTIPPHSSVAYNAGAVLQVVQLGAGATTITAGAGVTLRLAPGATAVMKGQYAVVNCIQSSTQDTWYVTGDLT